MLLSDCNVPNWLTCRIENRMNRTNLKYRQVGLDENAWRIMKPYSSAIFAWENLQGDKLLEVIQESGDVSRSVKIPLNNLSGRPMLTGNYSGFCVQVGISFPISLLLCIPKVSACTDLSASVAKYDTGYC